MSLSEQLNDLARSLGGIGAEGFLIAGFLALLLVEIVFLRRVAVARLRRWLGRVTIITLVLAGLVVSFQTRGGTYLFLHFLFLDDQAAFFKQLITIGAIAVVVWETAGPALTSPPAPLLQSGEGSRNAEPSPLSSPRRGAGGEVRHDAVLPVEWYPLLLALVLGLYLMTMAINLLGIYLSLELVSICSYLLTALLANRKASEGGIKYLLFGAISSAIMLYGMSLLYGMTGTLDLTAPGFGDTLSSSGPVLVTVAGLLTLAGLFFKLSLVPFHVWTPDAYEAAPVPVAAFFSVGPKVAALLVVMRIVSALPGEFQVPLAVVALASITLGNLSALYQTDAKRLLAYSTIAQAGFLLVGVVALSKGGFEAATFYMATYLPMSLAAFFLVDSFAQTHNGPLPLAALTGLGRQHPWRSVGLTVVMIGLTGLPPTVGFTAKLLSFSALYEAYQQSGMPWLLVLFGLGLLNAVVSLFYYLKIPYLLFFKQKDSVANITPGALSQSQAALVILLVSAVLWLFLQPGWLVTLIAEF